MPQIDPRNIKAFIRMYVEVGVCIWGLQVFREEFWLVPALLLSYFSGHLLQGIGRVVVPKAAVMLTLPLGLAALAIGMALVSRPILFVALFAIGYCLGPVLAPAFAWPRRRLVKIGAKLLGMVGAAAVLGGAWTFGILAVTAGLLHSVLANSPDVRSAGPKGEAWNSIDAVNVFHQSSYFCFAFVFWALWLDVSSWAPAAFFALGWIGYWAMELRLTAEGTPYRPSLLAAGHLFVAAVLLGMVTSTSPVLLMLGWFLSGIGGGTCYTMERASCGKPNRFSDDVGAVLGVATAAGVLALVDTPRAALVAGSCYAIIAAALALLTRGRVQGGRTATCES